MRFCDLFVQTKWPKPYVRHWWTFWYDPWFFVHHVGGGIQIRFWRLDRTGEMGNCAEWRVFSRVKTTLYLVSSDFASVFLPQSLSDRSTQLVELPLKSTPIPGQCCEVLRKIEIHPCRGQTPDGTSKSSEVNSRIDEHHIILGSSSGWCHISFGCNLFHHHSIGRQRVLAWESDFSNVMGKWSQSATAVRLEKSGLIPTLSTKG
jgi:hypothetical protein